MIAETNVFFFFSSKVVFYGKKLFIIVKAFFKSTIFIVKYHVKITFYPELDICVKLVIIYN